MEANAWEPEHIRQGRDEAGESQRPVGGGIKSPWNKRKLVKCSIELGNNVMRPNGVRENLALPIVIVLV